MREGGCLRCPIRLARAFLDSPAQLPFPSTLEYSIQSHSRSGVRHTRVFPLLDSDAEFGLSESFQTDPVPLAVLALYFGTLLGVTFERARMGKFENLVVCRDNR